MAKTFNRPVDKVERKARLAGVRQQRDLEEREFRNAGRMGWVPEYEDTEEDEENSEV